MSIQLPLNIQLRDDETFASFYVGDNSESYQAVKDFAQGYGESYLYLWGKKGVGKSHLLQAACHAAAELKVAAVYIPLKEFLSLPVDMLENLEKIPLVCLDDIHAVAGNRAWEENVFHLFNRSRSNHVRLLIAAEQSSNQVSIQLPDLKSRLTWGISYNLHPLNDEQKLEALKLRAHQRGLELNDAVGHFLLNHCPRNMNDLFHALERLDRASLAQQRRLTVPFVKEILIL